MKVKIIKSIDIADKSPSMPIVNVVEGEIRDDLSDHVANRLIELGCAEVGSKDATTTTKGATTVTQGADGADKDKVTEVTPESLKAELEGVALEAMDGIMGSEKKAKAALEAIGKERYQFDVDKRMGIDKITEAIVKEAFKDSE